MPHAADRTVDGGRYRPDRRPQIHELVLTAHGAVMSLQLPEERVGARLRALLPPDVSVVDAGTAAVARADVTYEWTRTRRAPADTVHRVIARESRAGPADVVACTRDVDEGAARLADDVEFRTAVHARTRLFVHAAAVAWQGRAILAPGRSFSGKSALAAALLRAGADYLSDEWAVLDADGLVHPYARPLRERDPDGAPRAAVSPRDRGWRIAREPVPVGLVVWTRHAAGASWRPERMTGAVTALALLDNAPAARRDPAFALRFVARAVDDCVGLRGLRGDADATAADVLEALRSSSERPR